MTLKEKIIKISRSCLRCHTFEKVIGSRCFSSKADDARKPQSISILGHDFNSDHMTNITPRILSKINKLLHNQTYHPLNLIRKRIQNFFYTNYTNRAGNPIFAVFDNLSPVVTNYQNFDSLLTAADHPSRQKSDTYYLNSEMLLRSHTSAHQEDLIRSGLDSFLVVGDVYRRDEIDASHYPVFHQMEGVRLFTDKQLFADVQNVEDVALFDTTVRCQDHQATHSLAATKMVEFQLKSTLLGLAKHLFGKDLEYRWVDSYFPFTHPSWELEIMYNGDWMEMLGCGVVEQQILTNAGVENKVGWAFGLGLERLAMKLYTLPDIRLFWSTDPGVLRQFKVDDPETPITYKQVSVYPSCINDISFWLPNQQEHEYSDNDFYDLVGSIAGDIVESVELKDVFKHPKRGQTSHCYTITYRHLAKTFTQSEVNEIHQTIEKTAKEQLGVTIR